MFRSTFGTRSLRAVGPAALLCVLLSLSPGGARAASDPTIAAVGDMACSSGYPDYNGGNGTATSCRYRYVSDLVVNPMPAALLVLGDNQYENGALADFQQSYDPTYGRANVAVYPSIGNAEYDTKGAKGFFQYFQQEGVTSRILGAATDASHWGDGYYSFNVGAWHLIALNSNCKQVGGCGSGSTAGEVAEGRPGRQSLSLHARLLASPALELGRPGQRLDDGRLLVRPLQRARRRRPERPRQPPLRAPRPAERERRPGLEGRARVHRQHGRGRARLASRQARRHRHASGDRLHELRRPADDAARGQLRLAVRARSRRQLHGLRQRELPLGVGAEAGRTEPQGSRRRERRAPVVDGAFGRRHADHRLQGLPRHVGRQREAASDPRRAVPGRRLGHQRHEVLLPRHGGEPRRGRRALERGVGHPHRSATASPTAATASTARRSHRRYRGFGSIPQSPPLTSAPAPSPNLLRFGKVVVDRNAIAHVPVRCNTILVPACQGTISVALVTPAAAGTSSRHRVRRLVRYSIAAGAERTIKVAFTRLDTRALKRLSRRRLAQRRLGLRATIELGTGTLQQTFAAYRAPHALTCGGRGAGTFAGDDQIAALGASSPAPQRRDVSFHGFTTSCWSADCGATSWLAPKRRRSAPRTHPWSGLERRVSAGIAACAATAGCRCRCRLPPRDAIRPPVRRSSCPRGRPLRDKIVLRAIAIDRAVHFVLLSVLAAAILLFAANQAELRGPAYRALADLQGGVGGPAHNNQHGLIHELATSLLDPGRDAHQDRPRGCRLRADRRRGSGRSLAPKALGRVPHVRRDGRPASARGLTSSFDQSPLKLLTLLVNLAIVAYLLLAKRLFGLRGGVRADEAARMQDTGWPALVGPLPAGSLTPAAGP